MKKRSPLNILLVEDDEAAAHLIRTNLKRSQAADAYFLARDGGEALKMLERKNDDSEEPVIPRGERLLILLDIRMPGIDGMQVLQYLKNSPELKKIPVVMLTTSDRATEIEKCYTLGCNLYMKKNVDYALFVEAVKKLSAFISVCEIPIYGDHETETP